MKHREESSTTMASQNNCEKAISKVIAKTSPGIAILQASTRSNTKLGCRLNLVFHIFLQLHNHPDHFSLHSGDPYKYHLFSPLPWEEMLTCPKWCWLFTRSTGLIITPFPVFWILQEIHLSPYGGEMGGSNVSLIPCNSHWLLLLSCWEHMSLSTPLPILIVSKLPRGV